MKTIQELNQNWLFREVGDKQWRTATVPGHVHLDLMQHELIEDPYWRDNETRQQWIGERDWEYRSEFEVSDDVFQQQQFALVFDGLDTYADVYLNGDKILTADNMYCGWTVELKQSINVGLNQLHIVFHSVVKKTLPLYEQNGFVYPANNSQPEPKLSVYSRKPGYHYGWDWGPRLVTSGIWRPISLVSWQQAKIDKVQFVQHALTKENAHLSLNVELENTAESHLLLRLSDASDSFEVVELEINSQQKNSTIHFNIEDPKWWWTLGLGEQHLYQLHLELISDGRVLDTWQHKVGLRTIEVIHEKDTAGKSFYFKLNGNPLYIKGSNCIPADFFVPRLDEQDYRKLLGYAAEANMNMLRLWGGAIYEEKYFYDLCDELGILVWQDFMFACAAYPADEVMSHRIEQEAQYNIERLRNHTCIALWCGNNEIDEGWHNWGWQERYGYTPEASAQIWGYYEKIFHQILPQAVTQYDSQRHYWPSSPKYGFEVDRAKVDGDMHYWGVWFLGHDKEQFKKYLPRFMSEYGLQAMPELATIKAFSNPDDWDLESQVMVTHQKQYANPKRGQLLNGYGRMLQYLEREYCVPQDFGKLAYVSQLLQADYIRFAIHTHRVHRPYCMGTLYWQLNDMWPVTSWATVDYYGRWKAAHYAVRDAYKPVIAVIERNGEILSVSLISDLLQAQACEVDLQLITFTGAKIWHQNYTCETPINSSAIITTISTSELLNACDSRTVAFIVTCSTEDVELARDYFYFHANNELQLPKPNVAVEIHHIDDQTELLFSTDTLAKNIFIESNYPLSDNYFDLLPGQAKRIVMGGLLQEPLIYWDYTCAVGSKTYL